MSVELKTDPVTPPTVRPPAEARADVGEASGRGVAGYVLVAGAALVIGVGGTWAVMRASAPAAAPAVKAPAAAATGHEGMPGMEAPASGSATPVKKSGQIQIPAARQQLIGVRTEEAAHRTLDRTIRAVGVLAYDETRVAEVHTKIAGWVERVYVDFVGKPVRRGQPLLTVYSPELVATQKEYLLALEAQRRLASSEFAETKSGAESLLASTRERLRLWDITDAQVAELERTRQARRTMTLYSPATGVILERKTFAGQYLTPEMATVKVADLSTVWAVGEVFEYELSAVKVGQDVTVEFPYGQSSRAVRGRVAFIYPDVDATTRRGKVRVEFPNPGSNLKPGSYVTLTVGVPSGMALAVSREAVIDTGTKQYVILAKEGGFFEPREVKVGAVVGGYRPVESGLSHGDRVVTSAQFLIDSETNLQSAMKAMVGHGHAMEGTGSAPDGGATPPPDHSKHQQ